jgi:HTH-type transcriptional regulator/antitoxin HigA
MTTIDISPIDHPGSFIKEEMEARGWIQRDLAFVLGCNEQALNAILSGKRGISAEMAKALGDAFDVPAEFFANLQQAYDLAHTTNPYPGVQERGRMQSVFPVREMIQRGWIVKSDAAMLESQLTRFFEKSESGQIPYLAHAAKKSRYEERDLPPVQLAWLFRVRQIAKAIQAVGYSERKLRAALVDLEKLLVAPEEARHVSRIMAECGVKLVFVEKLPGANIDGVCFWIGSTPVIGMSLRRDTIDNFWFVLRHEIEHVLNKDGRDDEVVDVLDGENASTTSEAISKQERVANAAAADFCAPSQKLDLFMQRKRPFFGEKDVLAFARIHHRHPGLVVGQMQKRMDRWDYLTRHLARIRQFALSGGIVDGWGHQAPVSL